MALTSSPTDSFYRGGPEPNSPKSLLYTAMVEESLRLLRWQSAIFTLNRGFIDQRTFSLSMRLRSWQLEAKEKALQKRLTETKKACELRMERTVVTSVLPPFMHQQDFSLDHFFPRRREIQQDTKLQCE